MRISAQLQAILLSFDTIICVTASPHLQRRLIDPRPETVDAVSNGDVPLPPEPEPVEITELPLPPVITSGALCTLESNPRGTGCIGQQPNLQNGNFLPDSNHVLAVLNFTGAPAAPDPASIYSGMQLIIIKVDGDAFSNGDPWKCITCGVPEEQQLGRTEAMDYPQAFSDGTRVLMGTNIVDCGCLQLTSDECTPENTYIYPIRWNVKMDGSGPGGNIRELRIHPDDVHLGFNSFSVINGNFDQFAYFSGLKFNPFPASGEPLSPRYDLENVYRLFNPDLPQPISTEGSKLIIDRQAISVGELRGFSGSGQEVTYIGYPAESSNIDVFAANLQTGKVRRLTAHPEYVDPVDISPDDEWTVVMDTRGTGRQMFIAGMRGIPPVTDLVSSSATSSTRNNGQRRFFQPWLIDRYGDRGSYYGQKLNAEGNGSPGSINDPEWNGRADPKWSSDGTLIAYYQQLTVPPACGGQNPLPCQNSTADGGRIDRLMLARLVSRTPKSKHPVAVAPDEVPWGVRYEPGSPDLVRPAPAQGNYTLQGEASGSATVGIFHSSNGAYISRVVASYSNFSDNGVDVLDGSEDVSRSQDSTPTLIRIDWYSNLTSKGDVVSTKLTSPDGFHLEIDILENNFDANGTLTTTIDGKEYRQPANGT